MLDSAFDSYQNTTATIMSNSSDSDSRMMVAPFSVDSAQATPMDTELSVPTNVAYSSNRRVPTSLVPSAGCGWFNLTQDSRGVYSLSLFLLCLGSLWYFFLFEQAQWLDLGNPNSTCKQMRVVDTAALCSVSEPDVQYDAGVYNHYGSHDMDNSILSLSMFISLAGNTVYHRCSVLFLLGSAGMQAYVFSRYAVDAPNCAWSELSTNSIECLGIRSSPNPCESSLQEKCQQIVGTAAFRFVSLFNLTIFLVLGLILLSQAVAMYRMIVAHPRVRAFIASRFGGSPWCRPILPFAAHRHSVDEWFEQHLFGRLFATDEQQRWLVDIAHQRHILRAVRLRFSLRVTFACAFSLFVVSTLTVTAVVTIVNRLRRVDDTTSWAHQILACVLAGAVTSCCTVWLMVFVHRIALRIAIKRRLLDYFEAEQTTQSIDSVLHSAKVRWFSLPFYFGSLFASMLWSYVIVNVIVSVVLVSLVYGPVREMVWPWFVGACLGPALLILLYRVIAFACVFGRCSWNHQVPLSEPPPRPRCYICAEFCGMGIAGLGSFMTVGLRLLAAFPTSASRLDLPTSRYDFVHDQYLSLVEVETYRVYRDWKLQQLGVGQHVDGKECEREEQLERVVPV